MKFAVQFDDVAELQEFTKLRQQSHLFGVSQHIFSVKQYKSHKREGREFSPRSLFLGGLSRTAFLELCAWWRSQFTGAVRFQTVVEQLPKEFFHHKSAFYQNRFGRRSALSLGRMLSPYYQKNGVDPYFQRYFVSVMGGRERLIELRDDDELDVQMNPRQLFVFRQKWQVTMCELIQHKPASVPLKMIVGDNNSLAELYVGKCLEAYRNHLGLSEWAYVKDGVLCL